MHAAELLIVAASHSVFKFFSSLGPFGLLLLSALDSSFLFIPLSNDLLLIALTISNRSSPVWILYVAISSLGSLLGVLVVDIVMRTAGEKRLRRFVSAKRFKRIKSFIERRAGWAVFLSALAPPPFPFTAVIMTAATLQYSRRKLLTVVVLGRLVRFSLVALLALYFGYSLLAYAKSPTVEYLVYALIVMGVVGSTISILKWVRSPGHRSNQR